VSFSGAAPSVPLRVLLFDPVTCGHHWEYASFIGRHLSGQGDSASLDPGRAEVEAEIEDFCLAPTDGMVTFAGPDPVKLMNMTVRPGTCFG
jgi:hypothetical protein